MENLSTLQELIKAKNEMESKVLTGNSVLLIGTAGEGDPISTINAQSLKSSKGQTSRLMSTSMIHSSIVSKVSKYSNTLSSIKKDKG